MANQVRYTLKAAKRSGFVRGQSVTTPRDSEFDRSHKGDAAWTRFEVPGSAAPVQSSTRRAQDAYARLYQFLHDQAAITGRLEDAEYTAYVDMIGGNQATLEPLIYAAMGNPARYQEAGAIEPVDDEPPEPVDDEPPPIKEPRDLRLDVLDALAKVAEGSDSETTINQMVDLAMSIDLEVPSELPRFRVEVAQLLIGLASPEDKDPADPNDLGD